MTESRAYSGSNIFFLQVENIFIVIVVIEVIHVLCKHSIIQVYRKYIVKSFITPLFYKQKMVYILPDFIMLQKHFIYAILYLNFFFSQQCVLTNMEKYSANEMYPLADNNDKLWTKHTKNSYLKDLDSKQKQSEKKL